MSAKADKLINAAAALVKEKGGEILVAGAIGTMDRGPLRGNWYLVIECTGRRPDINHKEPTPPEPRAPKGENHD